MGKNPNTNPHAFQTYPSGLMVDVTAPDPALIRIEDIAHHLSNQSRFFGACRFHYSVAQHSVHVSVGCDPAHALVGLLHDATEAYLGDVIRPLKKTPAMVEYRSLERRMALAIGRAFVLGAALADLPDDVKLADRRMLATEKRDLQADGPGRDMDEGPPYAFGIHPWTPAEANQVFLNRFHELVGR